MHMLVTPIVGGVIGYFTNWLAIKMLFFPRYEVKVFGVKMPFTPGVLPKSKTRLAHTIGNTIGAYLLTDEALKNAIMSADIDDGLSKLMDEAYTSIKMNDNTIGSYFDRIFKSEKEKILSSAEGYVETKIMGYCMNVDNQQKLAAHLTELIKKYLKNTEVKPLANHGLAYVINLAQSAGKDYLDSDEALQFINEQIDNLFQAIENENRPINQILPENLLSGAKKAVIMFTPRMAQGLKDILLENEGLNDQLLVLTKKVVEDSVGQLIGSLLYRKVYQSIKESALELMSNPENMVIFAEKICDYMEELLKNKPGRVLEIINIPDDMKQTTTQKVRASLRAHMDDFINRFSGLLQLKLNESEDWNLYELLEKITPDFEEKFVQYVQKAFDEVIDKNGSRLIHAGWDKLTDYMMHTKISRIASKAKQENYEKVKTWILSHKGDFVEKGAAMVSEKIDIPKIVEEKIIELDVKQMEKIILEVAKKELNYITVMGGVLGLILGFIPGIINSIF